MKQSLSGKDLGTCTTNTGDAPGPGGIEEASDNPQLQRDDDAAGSAKIFEDQPPKVHRDPDLEGGESNWSFEAFMTEQRLQETRHDANKERAFEKVLSCLGGPTVEAAELSPDVLSAWQARKEKLAVTEQRAEETKRKLKVRQPVT